MDRKQWGKENSGVKPRTCPVGHAFTGGPAKKCPECKKTPIQVAEGVIELSGFRVRVILEPIT
jgi:hypothetical protein